MEYVVQPGDTLFVIARRFGVSLSTLLAVNPEITDPDLIFPGQVVRIPLLPPSRPPVGRVLYVVQPGDTLSAIARRHGVDLTTLIHANPQIANPDLIFPGQVIFIPVALPAAMAVEVQVEVEAPARVIPAPAMEMHRPMPMEMEMPMEMPMEMHMPMGMPAMPMERPAHLAPPAGGPPAAELSLTVEEIDVTSLPRPQMRPTPPYHHEHEREHEHEHDHDHDHHHHHHR